MENQKQFMTRLTIGLCLLSAIAATSLLWNGESIQAADDELSLSAFMRKKLDASSQILEGLTVEDAELIEKGAATLLQLSKAEKWQVLISPAYREDSDEFRTDVLKLQEVAKKANFDSAALQWFDVMKGCIDCHKHVRDERAEKTNKK